MREATAANCGARPIARGASLDESLATLASVLRSLGQLRFPLAELEGDFPAESEQWARHVMTGGTSPVGLPEDGDRHWRGIRDHVRRRRIHERDYIASRIAGFTDVLGDVLSQLHGLAGSSEQTSEAIQRTMARLAERADQASLEELRTHVHHTVRGVRTAVENQRAVFSGRVRSLGERLAAVNDDLDSVQQEARLDPLTQLYTNTTMDNELERGVRVAELSAIPLTLVSIAIDNFERISMVHGIDASNDVIQAVADCVSLCFFRKSDTVSRYDEHRFVVLLWDTDLTAGERLAQRVLQKVRRLRVPHEPDPLAVTASVGVSGRVDHEHHRAFVERCLAASEAARIGGGDRRERG